FGAVIVALSLLVPTVGEEVITESPSSFGVDPVTGEPLDPDAVEGVVIDPETGEVIDPETGEPVTSGSTGAAGGSGASGAGGGSSAGGSDQQGAAGAEGVVGSGAATGGVAQCGGYQVPQDPYSPPCLKWSGGDNGGATSKGVTGDSIKVAVRLEAFTNGVADALSRVAKAKIPNESTDKITNTVEGLVEFFNRTYEFYGRKLELQIYSGAGIPAQEILGGGQESAQRDALRVASELGSFVDASAITPPYLDALRQNKIIAVGAPFVSQSYMTQRRPYVWSPEPDCTVVARSVASYYLQKMAGKPATLAKGPLQGKPRRLGIVAPDNAWYQECANTAIDILNKGGAGSEIVLVDKYSVDLANMAPQANSVTAKLRANDVTTVLCMCDPVLLVFLTTQTGNQNYIPEWLQTGMAFTDLDLVGQIMDPREWNGAFGVSFRGPTLPTNAGPGYRAFKAVRPNEEPSQSSELMYGILQIIAIGVQLAGPNLTPESFEAGLFRYPARTGALGTWKFGPGDYTPQQDAREVFYSASTRSPQNGDIGAWIDTSGGKSRYPIGGFPPGNPPNG
ncbi:MAG: hypothetical protein ACR2OH_04485, partial [Microthrixaceae bacterium]